MKLAPSRDGSIIDEVVGLTVEDAGSSNGTHTARRSGGGGAGGAFTSTFALFRSITCLHFWFRAEDDLVGLPRDTRCWIRR